MRLRLGGLLVLTACSQAADPDPSDRSALEAETTFVGRLDTDTLVALESYGDTAVVYICRGNEAEWLKGHAQGEEAHVGSSTRSVDIRYLGATATGVLHEPDGRDRPFELGLVTDARGPGLYAADGIHGRTGAIVLIERGEPVILGSYFVGPGLAHQVTPVRPVDASGVLVVRLGTEARTLARFRIAER